MSAPDFYFVNNAMFRHIHDRYGMEALVEYWRDLAATYYAGRATRWRSGGAAEIARDWREYFALEPQAQVDVQHDGESVTLNVHVCPAIKHLRDNQRDIVPYFCDHCDHTCSTMAKGAGFEFARQGGMGSCTQRFVAITVAGRSAG